MPTNHMIIALGGTGAKIIREFRKSVFRQFRTVDAPNCNIQYLLVDSTDEHMGRNDENWKILGKNLQLSAKAKVLTREADLQARIRNIEQFPGIKPWIGPKERWIAYLRSADLTRAAAGQKRRLGRFLFACNAKAFEAQLRSQVNQLRDAGNETAVTFHVCCGLAGGTGSGSVIDVVSQIRNQFRTGSYQIILYCLLPETVESTEQHWDSGYYHENGYAALLELNALSIGELSPHNVLDFAGKRINFRAEEAQADQTLTDSFNVCYVFTKENEYGVSIRVNDELPSAVADFIFQKTAMIEDLNNWGQLSRAESGQTFDLTPETAFDGSRPLRSKRFMTFGIKRLAIPEEEITEFLTFTFARQAALQLRYNNHHPDAGYQDDEPSIHFEDYVTTDAQLEKWLVSDQHLMLSRAILPDDDPNSRWKTIERTWTLLLEQYEKDVKKLSSRDEWLVELEHRCDYYFETQYRNKGVASFYKAKFNAANDYASEIRRRIARDLFEDWTTGTRSISEISKILHTLRRATAERLDVFEKKIVELQEKQNDLIKAIETNKNKAKTIGFLGDHIWGKRKEALSNQRINLEKLYQESTEIQGRQFGVKLLGLLINELDQLAAEADGAKAAISAGLRSFDELLQARCKGPAEKYDFKKQLVAFYNSDQVRRVTWKMVKNDGLQKGQASTVRKALIQKLPQHPSFKDFNEHIPAGKFRDILTLTCKESALEAHDNLSAENKSDRLLGVNILDKLGERYRDDEELDTFLSSLIKYGGNFAKFNETERCNESAGDPSRTCQGSYSVIMPASDSTVSERIKAALRDSIGGERGPIEFVETSSHSNEICLVSLMASVPLRTLELVEELRREYDQHIERSPENRMFLHVEGDGSDLPSLFGLRSDEVQAKSRSLILLAKALGLVKENKSVTTEEVSMLILVNDARNSHTYTVNLGDDVFQAAERIDEKDYHMLKEAVDQELGKTEYQPRAAREQVEAAINTEVATVLQERKGDLQDLTYKAWNQAGNKAKSEFLKLV